MTSVWDDDRPTAPLTKRKTHDSVTNRPRDGLSVYQCIAPGGDNPLGLPQISGT